MLEGGSSAAFAGSTDPLLRAYRETNLRKLAVRSLSLAAISLSFMILTSAESLAGAPAGQAQDAAKKEADGPSQPTKDKASPATPRKIVLIAGPKDEHHGPGTHDYEATINTIKEALEASNVADQVEVTTVTNGWPEDPSILDDADTIFLASAGADHKETDHPFLVGDRMQVLAKQMKRGCGLVVLHWSVFVPIKYEKQFSEWLGGFFDYQRGDDPRGWYSRITFATAKIHPNPKHPIAKGVPPFEQRDEYYYNIRFREKDERITPIVKIKLPDVEEPQVVAWTVERKNGGRSFAFTGGHFQKSWEDDAYRALMLNAICWTAKVKVPAGGVHKQLAFDDQWTPKPHLGKEDLPKETEDDWYDGRIRESDIGPYFTASIVAPSLSDPSSDRDKPVDDRKLPHNPNMVVKALAIKLGGKDGTPAAGVLFDKEKMVLRCGWTGGFLNFSDRRFGLLEMPTVGGEVAWSVSQDGQLERDSAGGCSMAEAGDACAARRWTIMVCDSLAMRVVLRMRWPGAKSASPCPWHAIGDAAALSADHRRSARLRIACAASRRMAAIAIRSRSSARASGCSRCRVRKSGETLESAAADRWRVCRKRRTACRLRNDDSCDGQIAARDANSVITSSSTKRRRSNSHHLQSGMAEGRLEADMG